MRNKRLGPRPTATLPPPMDDERASLPKNPREVEARAVPTDKAKAKRKTPEPTSARGALKNFSLLKVSSNDETLTYQEPRRLYRANRFIRVYLIIRFLLDCWEWVIWGRAALARQTLLAGAGHW